MRPGFIRPSGIWANPPQVGCEGSRSRFIDARQLGLRQFCDFSVRDGAIHFLCWRCCIFQLVQHDTRGEWSGQVDNAVELFAHIDVDFSGSISVEEPNIWVCGCALCERRIFSILNSWFCVETIVMGTLHPTYISSWNCGTCLSHCHCCITHT